VLETLYHNDRIISDKQLNTYILAAFFHDIVYVPGKTDNEEQSVAWMKSVIKPDIDPTMLDAVINIIMSTKCILNNPSWDVDIFQSADCSVLSGDFATLVKYEHEIFKEFQRFSVESYRKGRVEFLEKTYSKLGNRVKHLPELIDYVKTRPITVGVYAGSFNPFHVGHLDVLEQSERMFDKVVIARGINLAKSTTLSDVFPETLRHRECKIYSGFLSTFIKQYESDNPNCKTVLVRGLRNEYDLNYEQNLIQLVKDQMPNLTVSFFLCDREHEHVSSTAIRTLESIEVGSGSKYIVV
jgi:pantetheine-phosphate adenylyltransferase